MSSAICFNLYQSKILLSGNGLKPFQFVDVGDDSSFDSNASVGSVGGMTTKPKERKGVKTKSSVERAVFEEQLNQLQEQLVAAMIENQALSKCLCIHLTFNSFTML